MFDHLTDAIAWIESIKRFGDKLDLSRMELACELLGHPERDLPVIHIAGTNGKGSVVSYLKFALMANGYKVGTYTSPYIVRFNERIHYDGEDISDVDLLHYINRIRTLHETIKAEYDQIVTFFELVTLMSFLYFSERELDYVIYEVGLGGRLDATNVVIPLMTAITSISYDHMGVLGDTLESIAWNKLGIVKPGVPMVTAVTEETLMPVFERMTEANHSDLIVLDPNAITDIAYGATTAFNYQNERYEIRLMGTHQVTNAALAIEILHQMEQRQLVRLQTTKVQTGLKQAFWPGRMERIGNVILDGAHNIGAAEALADTMRRYFPDHRITVLYTSMADKEYYDILQVIGSFADTMVLTQIPYPRCESAETLYEVTEHPDKHLAPDPALALLEWIPRRDKELLLVTGSLYFVSFARSILQASE
jgi:dihydrofolate synthase/folylpolyglutamate synthase